jgi:hypothetical protein
MLSMMCWLPLVLLAATQTAPGPLSISLRTDKATYRSGEPIVLTLSVANTGERAVTLHFNTSQRYDFTMQDASGREVWSWAQERMFLQVLGQEVIEPGEKREHTERFLGTPAPGRYRFTGRLAAREATAPAFASITIE